MWNLMGGIVTVFSSSRLLKSVKYSTIMLIVKFLMKFLLSNSKVLSPILKMQLFTEVFLQKLTSYKLSETSLQKRLVDQVKQRGFFSNSQDCQYWILSIMFSDTEISSDLSM